VVHAGSAKMGRSIHYPGVGSSWSFGDEISKYRLLREAFVEGDCMCGGAKFKSLIN
jgi:hypothetical protein